MRGCSSWAFRLSLPLIFGTSFLMSGCGPSRTIWSAESRSPDGQVIASARSVVINKGLSITTTIETNVYLQEVRAVRGSSPILILQLADATDSPTDTRVAMNWMGPTHLELTVSGDQTSVFRAVEWGSVDISLRDLSKAAVEGENATRSLVPTPPPFADRKTAPSRPTH
jgi:hypothetical protein